MREPLPLFRQKVQISPESLVLGNVLFRPKLRRNTVHLTRDLWYSAREGGGGRVPERRVAQFDVVLLERVGSLFGTGKIPSRLHRWCPTGMLESYAVYVIALIQRHSWDWEKNGRTGDCDWL